MASWLWNKRCGDELNDKIKIKMKKQINKQKKRYWLRLGIIFGIIGLVFSLGLHILSSLDKSGLISFFVFLLIQAPVLGILHFIGIEVYETTPQITIIAIVSIGYAFLGAIIGALLGYIYQKIKERKTKNETRK